MQWEKTIDEKTIALKVVRDTEEEYALLTQRSAAFTRSDCWCLSCWGLMASGVLNLGWRRLRMQTCHFWPCAVWQSICPQSQQRHRRGAPYMALTLRTLRSWCALLVLSS